MPIMVMMTMKMSMATTVAMTMLTMMGMLTLLTMMTMLGMLGMLTMMTMINMLTMILTTLVTWHWLTRKSRLSREAPLKGPSWRSVPVMLRITLDLWIKISTRKIMRKNYSNYQITCPLATKVLVNAGPGDPEETFLISILVQAF